MDLAYQFDKWRAIGLLVLGRKATARAVFDAMLQRWPDDVYALASRAHLLTEAGQVQAALADSRRLVVLRAEDARTWFNHGFMLEAAGELAESETAFRRATTLSPELDRAWYGLGLVLIRLHRYDEAVVALKKNTELQPMSPYGWYQLAHAYHRLGDSARVARVIKKLAGFEPKVARQLERETGVSVGVDVPF